MERFLEEAVESVLAQTYDRWELLLVDDGSTDASTAIAQRYVECHPGRVRYLEHDGHENRGMSAARNLGLRHARGEYVAFLDADDLWLPQKLADQVALFRKWPEAGMVCGATLYWRRWGGCTEWTGSHPDAMLAVGGPMNPMDLGAEPLIKPAPETLVEPPALMTLLYPLGKGSPPSMSNLIVRRDVAERVGGFDEHFTGLFEDHVFLTKLYLTTPVLVASTCWDKYRQHEGSCVALAAKERQDQAKQRLFLRWLEAYLSERNYEETEIWAALQEALSPHRHPVSAYLADWYRNPLGRASVVLTRLLWRVLPTPTFLRLRDWRRRRWRRRMICHLLRLEDAFAGQPVTTSVLVANGAAAKPLVSVIVPFRNAEPFLGDAIASVFAQTYPHWELLVVDGGSTDGSRATARAYAQRHPDRVRYLQPDAHESRGMDALWDLGVVNARGAYIAFLDPRDLWVPRRVERYVAVLEERPEIDLVYGPCLYWYSWSGEPEGRRRDHVGDIGIAPGTVVGSPRLRKRFLAGKGGFRPRVSNILARRTVIDRVSSLEEPPRGIDEDQAFLAKISSNAVIYLIDECLDRHRPHQTSRAEVATSAAAHVPAGTDFHGGISSNGSRPRPRSNSPAPGAAVETSQSVGGDLDRQTRLSPERSYGSLRQPFQAHSWSRWQVARRLQIRDNRRQHVSPGGVTPLGTPG